MLLLSLLLINVVGVLGNVGVPLLMFKDSSAYDVPKQIVGHTISTDDFSALLLGISSPELVVEFIQDELSNEDFLRLGKDMTPGGLFKNTQKYAGLPTSTYFPSIKAPVASLKMLTDLYDERIELQEASKVVKYFTQTNLQKNTAIIVHLNPTANADTSARAISYNDEIVGDVMRILEKSGLTYLAFFTGRSHRGANEAVVQGVGRHLLETTVESEGNETVIHSDNGTCLIYAESITIKDKPFTDGSKISCDKTVNKTTVTLSDVDEVKMEFTADEKTGYWSLKSVMIGGQALDQYPDISAPLTFSYHCNEEAKFGNKNATDMIIKRIQIQLFEFDKTGVFGYAYDCTGFFTIPLWMGLLTALFLVSVTGYGLMMLSSVQTFDQYDDPKGKPLLVNISE